MAFNLAKAGHYVTAVARGERLQQLARDNAIVMRNRERAPIAAREALDANEPYDLVIVSLFATQVDAVLPTLRASRAKTVMFFFNTFESIDRFRDAVGPERFTPGFPGGIFSKIEKGVVTASVRAGTMVEKKEWAKVFREAEIPAAVEPNMQAWLRTHGAMVAPLMASGALAVFGTLRQNDESQSAFGGCQARCDRIRVERKACGPAGNEPLIDEAIG